MKVRILSSLVVMLVLLFMTLTGAAGMPPFWRLTGNSGTNPSTDFLGTTDNEPVVFRTNGTEAMRVDAAGNIGIGTSSPEARLQVQGSSTPDGTGALNVTDGAGTSALFVRDDGFVGLGTTSPNLCFDCRVQASGSTTGFASELVSVINVGSGGLGLRASGNTLGILGSSLNGAGPGTTGVSGAIVAEAIPGAGVAGFGASIGVYGAVSGGTANLFVGQSPVGTNQARIDNTGKGFFDGGTQVGGADFAESMRTRDDPATVEPGDVLAIDPANPGAVKKCTQANSQLVAGVHSTKPSLLAIGEHHIDESLKGEVPIAIVGIVPTKVTAENGPIRTGDLLVSSSTPGHAMKAKPTVMNGVEIWPTGAILGKALEPMEHGRRVIKVLVTLR